MRTLYLAYPIDKAATHPVTEVVAQAVDLLKEKVLADSSVLTYDPGMAWTVGAGRHVSKDLQEVNNKAIWWSDSMLAFVPSEVRSWGVPSEVALANTRGMNVAIVRDGEPTWAMPVGKNIRSFQVRNGDWVTAGIQALDWLADQKFQRHSEHHGSADLPVQFLGSGLTQLPTRTYHDDAGLDLYVSIGCTVPPGAFVDVPCGVAVQLPDWSWGFLVGRSSTLRKRALMVNPGIIDCGYRGELFAGVMNLGEQTQHLMPGDRIAQLIVLNNATRKVTPKYVEALDPHPRGTNGFGSSGA